MGREIIERFTARDFIGCMRQADARKADNTARQASAKADVELKAALLERARRRGQNQIDWPAYFRESFMT